jgi:hypothetical protein
MTSYESRDLILKKQLLNIKPKATTFESIECACKKLKITNELEKLIL